MERDEHIAKWVSLTAKKVSDNLSETDRRKGGRPGAAAAASRELNISERDVQRAVSHPKEPEPFLSFKCNETDAVAASMKACIGRDVLLEFQLAD